MSQQIKEDKSWICCWEKLVKKWGLGEFRLVHDGQRNPGQFEFPPEEVRFYTKVYRWFVDGQPVDTWVKFKYDLREGEVGVDVTFHDPTKPQKKAEKESMVLSNPKESLKSE